MMSWRLCQPGNNQRERIFQFQFMFYISICYIVLQYCIQINKQLNFFTGRKLCTSYFMQWMCDGLKKVLKLKSFHYYMYDYSICNIIIPNWWDCFCMANHWMVKTSCCKESWYQSLSQTWSHSTIFFSIMKTCIREGTYRYIICWL